MLDESQCLSCAKLQILMMDGSRSWLPLVWVSSDYLSVCEHELVSEEVAARVNWLCQGKISLLSRGKAGVLTLAQLFCISKDVRWERKWRVWIGDGPGTGTWDKLHLESRPPSSRWSCLVLIGCATSQLLFLLVWESILCHLRYCSSLGSPQRDYRWDQLFGCPQF